MKNFRRILLWVTAGGLGLLSLACIAGALLNAERAGAMFSSVPFIVVWSLLGLLLIASVCFFKRVRNSPALLAMHVGPLFVLLGTMYGSPAGHRMVGALSGTEKIESGYLVVHEGQSSSELMDSSLQEKVGNLPFRIHLSDFRIVRYPLDDHRWRLFLNAPGHSLERPIEWEEGQETSVSEVGLTVKVLEYIPSAQPVYGNGREPKLKIETADRELILPAEAGEQVELEVPPVTVRIEQVFSRLRVMGMGEERQIVDAHEGPQNPALKVNVDPADGEAQDIYVIPRFPMHGQSIEGLELSYVEPQVSGAKEADGEAPPAMRVLLRRGEASLERWLIPGEDSANVALPLSKLFADPGESDHADGAILYMFRPEGAVKHYKSDLVVMEEGQQVAEKTIEVNDPLHYGGYHLYQSSYDREAGRYSVLLVKSDSGLWMAYAGFILLTVGVFAGCWFDPLMSRARKKSNSSA